MSDRLSPATRNALVIAGLDPESVAAVIVRALAEDLPGWGLAEPAPGSDGPGAVDATSAATVDAGLVGHGALVSR
ncbi:nicotinate-nucleotide diphosphorylase (carboxylating), partial [Frankia sp. AgKG'84/4]|nr:nicotinate-nucleotide diphosphorylase (carboxylating) [Frankia sp. AgKG'84/4]